MENLIQCPLFKGLNASDIHQLFLRYAHHTHIYTSGEVIALRGESCMHLMIILKGSVRGEMIDNKGKLIKIEDIPAVKPIAMAFLFSRPNVLPVNITANEESEILFMAKDVVVAMMRENEQFLTNFLELTSNRAKFLSERLWFLSFKTIREKVANWLLLQLGDKMDFDMKQTQKELADYFGVTRPSLARTLGELQKEGMIQITSKKIKLINRQKLLKCSES